MPIFAQGYGQARVAAGRASIIYASAPLVNCLVATAVLGQGLGRASLLGAALIMSGHVLSAFAAADKEAAA